MEKLFIWIDRSYRQWRDTVIFWQLLVFSGDRYLSFNQKYRFFWDKINSRNSRYTKREK
jgi:hypothetical protein